jgi:hypothetical protein
MKKDLSLVKSVVPNGTAAPTQNTVPSLVTLNSRSWIVAVSGISSRKLPDITGLITGFVTS